MLKANCLLGHGSILVWLQASSIRSCSKYFIKLALLLYQAMAKRGAEDQLTKDDVESGGAGGSDEEEEEQVRRDAPKEALASRQ
jgi:hypothetical protein